MQTNKPQADGNDERAKQAAFWRFSLSLYGLPGVPAALLPLQDDCGADINVVLFGLWRAAQGRALSVREFIAVDEHVREWRDSVIRPARALRRTIKQHQASSSEAGELYDKAKRLELQGERIQQHRMAVFDGAPGASQADVTAAALQNLKACADMLGQTFPAASVSLLVDAMTAPALSASGEQH